MTCINTQIKQLNEQLNIKTYIVDTISIQVENITKPLNIFTFEDKKLNVQCYVTCSNKEVLYLNAQPDIIWLDRNALSSTSFNINSNVVWKIN